MLAEEHVRKWWSALTDDQRTAMKAAAERLRLDSDTIELLRRTDCPVGPVGSKWESQPDWDWGWPADVRDFILAN
jgi:hypothetical protein